MTDKESQDRLSQIMTLFDIAIDIWKRENGEKEPIDVLHEMLDSAAEQRK